DLVKLALDAAAGRTGSFGRNPEVRRTVNSLPTGLIALLYQSCDQLADLMAGNWPGCVASALSLAAVTEETVILRMLLSFETEAQAAAAGDSVQREGLALEQAALGEVETRQEGTTLHIQATGDTSQILESLTAQVQR
ncbi:MAG: hypothetical protein ACE5Q6_25735, partial [Dehalococcoidia bacterium]